MNNQKMVSMLVVAVIIAGGAGFYGGMTYEKGQATGGAQQARMGRGGGQLGVGGGRGGRGGFTVGQVLSKDATSLTIQLRSGGSQIVFYSPTTPITRTASGTPSDVGVGKNVMISGVTNADGSVNAESIQISPNFQGRGTGAGTPSGAQAQ